MEDSSVVREKSVLTASLAAEAKRYHEIVESMKSVAKMGKGLTVDERGLLLAGYWNMVGPRRDSWEILSKIELMEEDEVNVRLIVEYKQKVETEITDICSEVLSIIDEHLIPSVSEASVFYNKMKGDYYRYLAEFKTGSEMNEAADHALKAYESAMATAVEKLPRADPLRLGLELNFSVFNHMILDCPQRFLFQLSHILESITSSCSSHYLPVSTGSDIAKQAVDEATPELDSLSEEAYKESTKLLGILNENIKLWNSD